MIAVARRVLGNLEPFDLAITQLATTADTEANTPTHNTPKDTTP